MPRNSLHCTSTLPSPTTLSCDCSGSISDLMPPPKNVSRQGPAAPYTSQYRAMKFISSLVTISLTPRQARANAGPSIQTAPPDGGGDALDESLTTRKLAPASRTASHACGRQLAALTPKLAVDDPLVEQFARHVRMRETDGNLAIVSGTLARALGISEPDAVLLEVRGAAVALLSAAVRLGVLAPTAAQVALAWLAPALATAAGAAGELPLEETHSTAPELELYALAHARADARLFVT
ncbi:Urease accessory protein UreF [Capillimicrobium parvum]|uniref:Urease accessory protein UreF n=2 Tax=Capillimicrobium parvum TaxID=2884022 RepID=A0A9E6Y096_9ACTN|nr:Urease accessory protein UreF [Capillimicrobium parvum]